MFRRWPDSECVLKVPKGTAGARQDCSYHEEGFALLTAWIQSVNSLRTRIWSLVCLRADEGVGNRVIQRPKLQPGRTYKSCAQELQLSGCVKLTNIHPNSTRCIALDRKPKWRHNIFLRDTSPSSTLRSYWWGCSRAGIFISQWVTVLFTRVCCVGCGWYILETLCFPEFEC